MPDTELPLNIKPSVVGRYALGGALTGAGLASALNLAHMLREIWERRQADQGPQETDENTLVLTLPSKTAAPRQRKRRYDPVKDEYITDGNVGDYNASDPPKSTGPVNPEEGIKNEAGAPVKVKAVEGPATSANLCKKGNWSTLTASLLAMGAGGTLGYRLIDKLYELKRMKTKERELDDAKKEYLDMLAGGQKQAAVNDFFDVPMDKEARGRDTFGMIDIPLGVAALAFLLGSGGSAYITKRILDQMEEQKKPKTPKPAVKRIVFRSSEPAAAYPEDEAKMAEYVENLKEGQVADEVFDAALGVYLDIASGKPGITGDEKVAAELDRLGIDQAEFIKGAADDLQNLLATLEANPDLRQLMQRAYMEQHPIAKYFKWAVKLPGIRGMADRKLYESVLGAVQPKTAADHKLAGMLKEAGIFSPDLADIAASFYGSTLASGVEEKKREAEEAAMEAAKSPEEEARELLEQLQISADDPAAAEFVLQNRERIARVIERLAKEGKL